MKKDNILNGRNALLFNDPTEKNAPCREKIGNTKGQGTFDEAVEKRYRFLRLIALRGEVANEGF